MVEPRSGCPINAAVEAFGDSLEPARAAFRELLAGSEDRIASDILADRLERQATRLVPVFTQPVDSGLQHRPGTEHLPVRARLLADGGPELWAEFMDELRVLHLGHPAPERSGPGAVEARAVERLAAAHAAAR